TGDVGRRELLGEELREMIGRGVPRVGDLAGALVAERDERRRGGREAWLVELRVVLIVVGEAGIEQQPIALSPRPLRDRDEAGWRRLDRRRFRRHAAGNSPVAAYFVLGVVIVRDLVLRAELRRHAPRDAPNMAIVDARPAVVGRVLERRWIQ